MNEVVKSKTARARSVGLLMDQSHFGIMPAIEMHDCRIGWTALLMLGQVLGTC
jgi:hypothetical protein